MEKQSIEQRLQILEDKEAIKDITYQYALNINQGWNGLDVNPNALSEIFTTNAIWQSPIMNIHEVGLENIVKSLKAETQTVLFAMHSFSNPVIKVNGNTASGNWLFWVVSRMLKDKTNQVFMSQDIQYVKTKNGWRIQNVMLHFGDIVKSNKQE